MNLGILKILHEICFLVSSAQNRFPFENQNIPSQKMLTSLVILQVKNANYSFKINKLGFVKNLRSEISELFDEQLLN